MKPKRSATLMFMTLIVLILVLHNKLHSESNSANDTAFRQSPSRPEPGVFPAVFLRMAQ